MRGDRPPVLFVIRTSTFLRHSSLEFRHSFCHSSVRLLSFSKVAPVLNCAPSWFSRLQSHLASAADARSSLNRRIRMGTKRAAINSHWREDRKSTRLNSSHSQISYAVFCL